MAALLWQRYGSKAEIPAGRAAYNIIQYIANRFIPIFRLVLSPQLYGVSETRRKTANIGNTAAAAQYGSGRLSENP